MSDFSVKVKENAVKLAQATKKVSLLSAIAFFLFQLWSWGSDYMFNALCTNYDIACDIQNTKWYGVVAIAVGFLSMYLKKP